MIRNTIIILSFLFSVEIFAQTTILRKDVAEQNDKTTNTTTTVL